MSVFSIIPFRLPSKAEGTAGVDAATATPPASVAIAPSAPTKSCTTSENEVAASGAIATTPLGGDATEDESFDSPSDPNLIPPTTTSDGMGGGGLVGVGGSSDVFLDVVVPRFRDGGESGSPNGLTSRGGRGGGCGELGF